MNFLIWYKRSTVKTKGLTGNEKPNNVRSYIDIIIKAQSLNRYIAEVDRKTNSVFSKAWLESNYFIPIRKMHEEGWVASSDGPQMNEEPFEI